MIELLFAASVSAAAEPHGDSGTAQPPNIVLITLDTTRADHLGCWGWPHARTPRLDALAASGVRFERCDTAATVTTPSHATIMTGLLPPRHGIRNNGGFTLEPAVLTLAEALSENGFHTAAVVGAEVLAKRFGLNQGFETYDDALQSEVQSSSGAGPERDAEHVTDAAIKALAPLQSPYLLWVHYFDPHAEYRAPPRIRDAISGPNAAYDAEIAFMDEQLGRLLDAMIPSERARTLIVIVGDHGEMLGEHGEAEHGILPYSGARRVPLIFSGPGIPSGQVRRQLVRTVDVFPTVLELAGVKRTEVFDGTSLAPVLGSGDAPSPGPSYCESMYPFFAYGWHPLRALSDGRWLFISGGFDQLYDLAGPGRESVDVSDAHHGVFRRWQLQLEALMPTLGTSLARDQPQRAEETVADREMLESLGYVVTDPSTQGDHSDPRNMLDLRQDIHTIASAIGNGHCDEAVISLGRLIERDPGNPRIKSLLAGCELKQGRTESALARFTEVAKLQPTVASHKVGMGDCLRQLGRPRDAARAYRQALSTEPSNVEAASALAGILCSDHQLTQGIAVIDELLEHSGGNAAVYLARGRCHAAAGNIADALDDFRTAHRRNPTSTEILTTVANAAYSMQRFRESARYFEQLLRLDPTRAKTWKTLGAIYLYRLDDEDSASRCFRNALGRERDPRERATLVDILASLDEADDLTN